VPQRRDSPADVSPAPPERRPEVVLDVLFEDGLLFLALANIGDAPALKVSCRFRRKLRGLGGTKDVSKLPLFESLAFLGPGREIRTLLDSAASFFARGEPTNVYAKTVYVDAAGHSYETTVEHELAIYRELAYVPKGVAPHA
jgi:hypothetical protein